MQRQEMGDNTAWEETQIKYLCYLPSASARHHIALGLRGAPMQSSIKIKEISMQSSFPELCAEVFGKKRMWGLAAANVDVQDCNSLERQKVVLRAWPEDPKHFCTV